MTNRKAILYKYKNFDLSDEPDYQQLVKIGLTKMSIECYEVLIKQTFLATKDIANILNKPYRSVQRCLNDLQDKGFIKKVHTGYGPSKYSACLLFEAVDTYSCWQKQQISQIIEAQKFQYYEKELAKIKL